MTCPDDATARPVPTADEPTERDLRRMSVLLLRAARRPVPGRADGLDLILRRASVRPRAAGARPTGPD